MTDLMSLAKFLQEDDFNLVLYNDESEEAVKLRHQLLEKGYCVRSILGNGHTPVVLSVSDTVSGYADIRRCYVVN